MLFQSVGELFMTSTYYYYTRLATWTLTCVAHSYKAIKKYIFFNYGIFMCT